MTDPEPVVVSMRRRHLPGVAAIEVVSNPHPWSADLFESELRQASSRCLVAMLPRSRVVGFGCVMTTSAEAHVTNLGVDLMYRRRGVGSQVLDALVDQAVRWGLDGVTLEVRAGNSAARALYRAHGFEDGGLRKGYYRDNGEDAVIMWRHGLLGVAAATPP